MKVPYGWLKEWVRVPWKPHELGQRLTLAGFELEAVAPAAPPFSQVVVALIEEAGPHPQADKLRVCRVSTGTGAAMTIVCGAANARAGLRGALALPGATLPDGTVIRSAQLRGVESQGMLASAKELGLAEASSGILELPEDAPLGRPLREYLDLDEAVLDLNVTPNRGDAMSVLGIAREVAALAGTPLTGRAIAAAPVARPERLPVRLDAPEGCPRFAGCIVRGLDNARPSPLWLRERLRRAGLRSISPLVDVTNYVMLELGQPMHAYDLAKLVGGIRVRWGRAGERATLLDGRTVTCDPELLLITDDEGPVGLAGVMGGERTAVSSATREVYFESAWFAPQAILGRARRVGLATDASQRFERGVDPTQQARAIERALELLLPVSGGRSGGIEVVEVAAQLPQRTQVTLRPARLERLLGAPLPAAKARAALRGLQMEVATAGDSWQVTPPPWRFDIGIEADLIEEVARIVGFEAIPERDAQVSQRFRPLPEAQPAESSFLEALAARGYEEAISYAFVDPTLQQQLFPDVAALALENPISADLAVMRVSLWPGLLRAALENQHRQQERIRLFEHGNRFV
ncbi:MAG: phenylalanine--tRNA ligase subunit beta, partial [Gammaproteobacteria bacterium]|nr:phenylalanine--tRNA ligase subunit beta [Gammaproteobacteria bacterium]